MNAPIITKIDGTTLEVKVPEIVSQVAVVDYLAQRADQIAGVKQRLADLIAARDSYDSLIAAAQAEIDAVMAEVDSLGLKLAVAPVSDPAIP